MTCEIFEKFKNIINMKYEKYKKKLGNIKEYDK